MNIAFFIDIFYPEINGVITATLDLATNLSERGHKVLLVVPHNKHIEDLEWIGGIRVIKIPSIATFIYPGIRFTCPWSSTLFRTFQREKVEILHFTAPWTLGWAAINYSRRYSIPVIQTFHTMLNEDKYLQYFVKLSFLVPMARRICWWYFSKYIYLSDFITTPSKFACGVLKERFPAKNIQHISNGIDLSVFKNDRSFEEVQNQYPVYHPKTFIFVGRLGLEKSIDILIQGFSYAAKQDRDVHLLIIGDGPNRKDVEGMVDSHGVKERITLLGRIPHQELLSSGLIHHARAFVTASVTENQPMTVIESICCGLPLIVPQVPSMEELSDGNALFFPRGNSEELGERILLLANDDKLKQRLAAASRKMADQFDGARIADRFENLYREALHGIGRL